jgi:hypothetical protein
MNEGDELEMDGRHQGMVNKLNQTMEDIPFLLKGIGIIVEQHLLVSISTQDGCISN